MKTVADLIKEIYLPDLIEESTVLGFLYENRARIGRKGAGDADLESLLPPIEDNSVWAMILARVYSISNAVAQTCLLNHGALDQSAHLISDWMKNRSVVRVLGAGRALFAGSMPGNRLAHGGAQVSFMGGMTPMPNSALGGGIIACSASGKTPSVLEAMSIAKQNNPNIQVIGLARHEASDFRELCDVFIGIYTPGNRFLNPLSALADTEEYVISEILDGLVVMAGKRNGFDDEAWRQGHEDIGPTGPYSPKRGRSKS